MRKRMISTLLIACIGIGSTSCGSSDGSGVPESGSDKVTAEVSSEETTAGVPSAKEYVTVGRYEQDGNLSNGPEPIEWEVLSSDNGKMLLVSRYVLDAKPYNTELTPVTWETSSLRKWLNDEFLNTAFYPGEQEIIFTTTVANPDNEASGTEGGNDTQDKVFCLSVDEILSCYEPSTWLDEYHNGHFQSLLTEVTRYAEDQHVLHYAIEDPKTIESLRTLGYTDGFEGFDAGHWWLRTPGQDGTYACTVNANGLAGYCDTDDQVYAMMVGVRPAIVIDPDRLDELSSIDPTADTSSVVTESQVSYERNGNYIIFGKYEQDGDLSNGPEPIEWQILSEEDGKILVISRYILDGGPYNKTKKAVTWETSSLRSWLNSDFYNVAFDADEQGRILTTTLSNPDNAKKGTEGGSDTQDKLFCLSVDEVLKYFDFNKWRKKDLNGNCQALMADVTKNAQSHGVERKKISKTDYYGSSVNYDMAGLKSVGYTKDVIGMNCGPWWLRSPGLYDYTAIFVGHNGYVGWDCFDRVTDDDPGVRPAMYLAV